MRAALVRRHPKALPAVESILEHQRRDTHFRRREALEELLRIVRSVVITYSGVIAPDDKVRAAVIAPDNRVQDRPPPPAVPHIRRHHRGHRASLPIVDIE